MVNIAEAKAKFSHFVGLAAQGEIVVICDRGKPVTRMTAAGVRPGAGTLVGSMAGQGFLTEDALEPMSASELSSILADTDPPMPVYRVAETRRELDSNEDPVG